MDGAPALAPGVRANRPSATDPKSDARRLAAPGGHSVLCLPQGGHRSLVVPGPVAPESSVPFFNKEIHDVRSQFHGEVAS